MREEIEKKLTALVAEENIRLLYAAGSGSRAWGFASPDSDYDVRLLYSHPVEWYLALGERADTLESMDHVLDIDLSGWELRKALRLFAGCNPTLNEWLFSPIVYRQDAPFAARLRELVPMYFNPKKALFHYLGIAKGQAADHLRDDRITVKKAFYVLRPLAAGAWIRDLGTMPPTDFAVLLEGVTCAELQALRPAIAELVEMKATAVEKEPIQLAAPLASYIHRALPALEETAHKSVAGGARDFGPLDEVMRGYLKGPKL